MSNRLKNAVHLVWGVDKPKERTIGQVRRGPKLRFRKMEEAMVQFTVSAGKIGV